MEIRCDKKECDGKCPSMISNVAEEVLVNGGLIVYPTETLYGLGGDALDEDIVKKVKKVKKSPPEKKISVAYKSIEHASKYLDIPELAWEIADKFLPGPVTIVIETEQGTSGIRVPDHPITLSIIDKFGPITATSANKHNMVSPLDVKTAKIQLRGEVKLYINCGRCKYGIGSTVLKVTDKNVEFLREGVISKKSIGGNIEI